MFTNTDQTLRLPTINYITIRSCMAEEINYETFEISIIHVRIYTFVFICMEHAKIDRYYSLTGLHVHAFFIE
jgi:hypothetical protein